MDEYLKNLTKYFGFEKLRPFQDKVMKHLETDLLILSPTGSGKSLCYQLPAITESGLTVVLSPLKALIEDQVQGLKKRNVNVSLLNSDVSRKEKSAIYKKLKGDCQLDLLYTTPETLLGDSKLVSALKELNKNKKLNRIVIDEAHCVSTWGHDFRSSYLSLGSLKKTYPAVKMMALTATATPKVKQDIIKLLGLTNPHIETTSFFRHNLRLSIMGKTSSNLLELRELIKEKYSGKSGIIYCNSRRETERIASYLEYYFTTHHYHAGLDKNIRRYVQRQWVTGEIKIIVATIAFGMGIDKSDVRFVIHYNLPRSLEGYYQEIGRAGRDDKNADCILYYSYQDKIRYDKLIRTSKLEDDSHHQITAHELDQVEFLELGDDSGEGESEGESKSDKTENVEKKSYNREKDFVNYQLNKLNDMANFVENMIDCRHFLLSQYFGEVIEMKQNWCNGNCDNCQRQQDLEETDLTSDAKTLAKIIRTVQSDEPMTRKKLATKYRFDSGELPDATVDRLITRMILTGIISEELVRSEGGLWFENLCLKDEKLLEEIELKILTTDAKSSLSSFLVTKKGASGSQKSRQAGSKVNVNSKNPRNLVQDLMDDTLQEKYNLTHHPLYSKLSQYRMDQARRKKVAPYRILTNQSLECIVQTLPKTAVELEKVYGLGKVKVKEFGKDIVAMVLEQT